MLGIESEGMLMDKDGVIPVPGAPDVVAVSMDFLIQPHEALTWFDPLKKMTVAQFLYSVDYGEKDYLIIDLPPGTGAESYALLQYVPDLDGTVIVTQPSESPQAVASKSIELCRQADVPVLGIIENMSYFVCSNCQQTSKLCGTKGAENLADRMGVPFLGNIPLDSNIFMNCDDGVPFVVKSPESIAARSVIDIADKIIVAVENS
jgi:ATP-binding protein involved in chromosome partitioning